MKNYMWVWSENYFFVGISLTAEKSWSPRPSPRACIYTSLAMAARGRPCPSSSPSSKASLRSCNIKSNNCGYCGDYRNGMAPLGKLGLHVLPNLLLVFKRESWWVFSLYHARSLHIEPCQMDIHQVIRETLQECLDNLNHTPAVSIYKVP